MNSAAAVRPASEPDVDSAAFKAAMRRLAAGVTVVTSRHGGTVNGMTATAVCSVSAEPPLVLVALNRSSASHGVVSRGGAFALNFLREDQSELATYFAGRDGKSFDAVPHRLGPTGCPLIEGCSARLDCVLESRHDEGTHTIFVGRVVRAETDEGAPLVYGDGAFHGLKAV
ncbi:flavin reductase family protein [Methylopila turkensis]|uniref:Flavin reductase n=1 Tax=Methylopila turkensis TaxID=1437816 RepID=A0A9W6JL55_9HYPH|nr:flavin reductase family protein [Methylopila turkensis]GLK79187.1 flavin reductase [Methylopila turkensis]